MQFLPDAFVKCGACDGRRFRPEVLEVRCKGLSIADALDLPADDVVRLFGDEPGVRAALQPMLDLGLGYLRLGQSASTLSGGEAQRVRLARELGRRETGRTLYLLDEPTTGLHFDDVRRLLDVLGRLVDTGNTVVVIEHNLDVVKSADWVLDLGPEAGDRGGRIVAHGTPEQVARSRRSHTARYLRPLLASRTAPGRG
jgi:excinuclease ABC subunit A